MAVNKKKSKVKTEQWFFFFSFIRLKKYEWEINGLGIEDIVVINGIFLK